LPLENEKFVRFLRKNALKTILGGIIYVARQSQRTQKEVRENHQTDRG
jgi:hypothetical protein